MPPKNGSKILEGGKPPNPFAQQSQTKEKKTPSFMFGKTPHQPIQHIERKKDNTPIVPRDWNPFRPIKHLKQPLISPFSEIMADYHPETDWFKEDPRTLFGNHQEEEEQGYQSEEPRYFDRTEEFDQLYMRLGDLVEKWEDQMQHIIRQNNRRTPASKQQNGDKGSSSSRAAKKKAQSNPFPPLSSLSSEKG